MATEGPATAMAASERPPAGEDAPQPMSLRCRRACRSGFQKKMWSRLRRLPSRSRRTFASPSREGPPKTETWDVNPTEGRNNRNFRHLALTLHAFQLEEFWDFRTEARTRAGGSKPSPEGVSTTPRRRDLVHNYPRRVPRPRQSAPVGYRDGNDVTHRPRDAPRVRASLRELPCLRRPPPISAGIRASWRRICYVDW